MKTIKYYLSILIIALPLFSCSKESINSGSNKEAYTEPKIIEQGKFISMAPNQTDEIASEELQERAINCELKAPCKIVLSSTASAVGGAPSILADNIDLSSAIFEYNRTKSSIQKTKRQIDRLKALVEHQVAPEKDLLDAQSDLAQLSTTLTELENKLIGFGIDSKSLSLPIGKALVLADINESKLNQIKAGDNTEIIFNSYPNVKIKSKVIKMGNIVDPATRCVKALVEISNDKGKLMPGLYGQMYLTSNEAPILAAPIKSCITAKGKSFIFIEVKPGYYERREIISGAQSSEWAQILSGAQKGEKVVSKGAALLKALSFGY